MNTCVPIRHSRVGGNPSYGLDFKAWIPAYAGMTSDLRSGVQP